MKGRIKKYRVSRSVNPNSRDKTRGSSGPVPPYNLFTSLRYIKLSKGIKDKSLRIMGLIGILLLISLSIFVYAQSSQDLQTELNSLEQDLSAQGYGWLTNYTITPASIEVYRENDNNVLATFENILSESYYKIYLSNLSDNETADVFDLKVLGSPIEFDYIVDPITILTLQSYPSVGGNWMVLFNTSGQGKFSIRGFNGTTLGFDYFNATRGYDLEFLEVKCGNETKNMSFVVNGSVISYSDYLVKKRIEEIQRELYG